MYIMKNSIFTFTKIALLSIFVLSTTIVIANDNRVDSRISVINKAEKNNIYLSNFPANSLLIISDAENNLISVVTTNNEGVAVVIVNKLNTKSIHAKTIENKYSVSYNLEEIKKEETKSFNDTIS